MNIVNPAYILSIESTKLTLQFKLGWFSAEQIDKNFFDFYAKAIQAVETGACPKEICLKNLVDLSNRLNNLAQSKLSPEEMERLKEACKNTLAQVKAKSEIPLTPQGLTAYIKTIYIIGTKEMLLEDQENRKQKCWFTTAECQERLQQAFSLLFALTQPDLADRKKNLEDNKLTNEEIFEQYQDLLMKLAPYSDFAKQKLQSLLAISPPLPEQIQNDYKALLSICLDNDSFHKTFLQLLPLSHVYFTFGLSLTNEYFERFLFKVPADKQQEYLDSLVNVLTKIRRDLPNGIKDMESIQIVTSFLVDAVKLPRDVFSERRFIMLANEIATYLPNAAEIVKKEHIKNASSRCIQACCDRYKIMLQEWSQLQREIDQFKIEHIETQQSKIEELKNQLETSQDKKEIEGKIRQAEGVLKGIFIDLQAYEVEKNLFRSAQLYYLIKESDKNIVKKRAGALAQLLRDALEMNLLQPSSLRDLLVNPLMQIKSKEQIEQLHLLMLYCTQSIFKSEKIQNKGALYQAIQGAFLDILTKKTTISNRYYIFEPLKLATDLSIEMQNLVRKEPVAHRPWRSSPQGVVTEVLSATVTNNLSSKRFEESAAMAAAAPVTQPKSIMGRGLAPGRREDF